MVIHIFCHNTEGVQESSRSCLLRNGEAEIVSELRGNLRLSDANGNTNFPLKADPWQWCLYGEKIFGRREV